MRGAWGTVVAWGLILAAALGGLMLTGTDAATLATLAGPEAISNMVAGFAAAGMVRYAVEAQRIQNLRRQATPQASGDLEAVPWELYDTQTYVSAATTRLRFFNTAPATINLGNMEAAGMLPAPNWMSVACFGFDVLNDASEDAAELGALDDIQKLLLVGQPVWTLTISNKAYGPFRLSPIHGTGYAQGVVATGTADTVQVGAVGPVGDGGWYWDHSVIIPPNVAFNVEVVWGAAQTLAFGDTPLTFHIFGTLFRRVL